MSTSLREKWRVHHGKVVSPSLHFNTSKTKYTLLCIYKHIRNHPNTTEEAYIHGLLYLHSGGTANQCPRKIVGDPRLAFLQTPAKGLSVKWHCATMFQLPTLARTWICSKKESVKGQNFCKYFTVTFHRRQASTVAQTSDFDWIKNMKDLKNYHLSFWSLQSTDKIWWPGSWCKIV